ncbi:epidermal growth factor receptor substrate 15-like isoform X2 [Polyodon spathula]|uniref:epidermal growth factor receptor substrate 15-like isoform X2 n=1 Tax=Polyodon spathula TaxID=7913 RepID=UPI001B7EDFE9|nr:epidermal growth factor receptor substrate 15-like isoform X2 [Polyodon spathula]
MAASLSLTQLSSGNPVYEKYYRQVDLSNTGRVGASDAALFLKKSGLADLVLGKIWDLADAERKGFLNKREFFIALRLVACAQNGLDVSLSSLHLAVVPPKFHDTSSPQLVAGAVPSDVPWAVKPEEKVKFDAIFESLSPLNGMLSGDKVKPVLLNSKLPVDVLGRVWELSDIDRDGMLDRDEFAVAMYLVYRALEKEPVPMSLPAPLVPPSKRKKSALPSVVPLLPSPPSAKELRQSLPAGGMLPSKSPPVPIAVKWVVSPADRAKYDEVFLKTDKDRDGLVSGPEVRDIFLKTGLPSSTLAGIWELCDTKDCGKLSKEQFALALHLINQKLTKGVEPPQALTGDMIPPSDRLTHQGSAPSSLVADFSAIKELDSLSNEIVDLQREKTTVEQDIKENEDSFKQRTSEVQELQDEVARESEELQRLQAQRQEIQEVLGELDQQKAALEEQLSLIRQQSSQESQLISSLQAELSSQQSQVSGYEEELGRAREELRKLQLETAQMEQKVEAGKVQLEPLQQELHSTQQEIAEVQGKLSELQEAEEGVKGQLTWHSHLQSSMVNGTSEGERAETPEQQEDPETTSSPQEAEEELYTDWDTTKQADTPAERSSPVSSRANTMSEREMVTETASIPKEKSFDAQPNPPPQQASPSAQSGLDFFQSDPFTDSDPFKDDPFGKVDVSDPFGGDPFKGTDPFASDSFFKQPSADPFSAGGDPFTSTKGSTAPVDSFGAAASRSSTVRGDLFSTASGNTREPDLFNTTSSNAGEPDLFNTGEPDLFNTTSSNAGEPDLFNTGEPDLFNTAASKAGEPELFNTGEPDLFNTAASNAGEPDLFDTVAGRTGLSTADILQSNDPFAPGGTAVYAAPDTADPFASFFGNDSFGSGFADFSTLSKSNGLDPFNTSSAPDVFSSKNVFAEEVPKSQDTPPALPPKIGTPTRPPPPPPGKRLSLSRSESSDSYKRSDPFQTQGLGDPFLSESQDEKLRESFSTSSPSKTPPDPANFSSFNSYPTEEDLIEWAKRESEREEKERLARLTQQEQEDLELAIALSKSEISEV